MKCVRRLSLRDVPLSHIVVKSTESSSGSGTRKGAGKCTFVRIVVTWQTTQRPILCTSKKVIHTTRQFHGALISDTSNSPMVAHHRPIRLKSNFYCSLHMADAFIVTDGFVKSRLICYYCLNIKCKYRIQTLLSLIDKECLYIIITTNNFITHVFEYCILYTYYWTRCNTVWDRRIAAFMKTNVSWYSCIILRYIKNICAINKPSSVYLFAYY